MDENNGIFPLNYKSINYYDSFKIDKSGIFDRKKYDDKILFYHNNKDNKCTCKCLKCKNTGDNFHVEYDREKISYNTLNNDPYRYHPVLVCNECGAKAYLETTFLNTSYNIYLNHYLDDNKIKISCCYIKFGYFNENFIYKIKKEKIVINLDTGRIYFIKDTKRKSKIQDITYTSYHFNIFCNPSYNKTCGEYNDILNSVIEEIKKYNIKKYNLHENFFKHIDDSRKVYGNKFWWDPPFIASFNKFPLCVNHYSIYSDLCLKKEKRKKVNKIKRDSEFFNDDAYIKSIVGTVTKKIKQYYFNDKYLFNFCTEIFKLFKDKNNIYKIIDTMSDTNKFICSHRREIIFYIKYYLKRGIKETQIANRIKANIEKDFYSFNDTCYMLHECCNIYSAYELDYSYNIKDAHNILAKDYKILSKSVYDFNYKNIDKFNRTIGDYTFAVANNSSILTDIGNEMHICVGSYTKLVIQDKCDIIYVKENNKYVTCIEIGEKFNIINQVKGKYNSRINGDLYDAVIKYARDTDLYLSSFDLDIKDKIGKHKNTNIEKQCVIIQSLPKIS